MSYFWAMDSFIQKMAQVQKEFEKAKEKSENESKCARTDNERAYHKGKAIAYHEILIDVRHINGLLAHLV